MANSHTLGTYFSPSGLVYADGKTDELSRLAPSVIRELEVAGSDENLTIAAQIGRKGQFYDRWTKDWGGTRRYVIERNPNPPPMMDEMMRYFIPPYTAEIKSPVETYMGKKVDMGDVKSLKNFLKWGIKRFPAKHYAVIMYGPGAGFAGSMYDAESGKLIKNEQLADALKDASKHAGKKIDLVAFDANLMADAEVAHQIKDSADILVAPQAPMALGTLALDMVAKDLKFGLREGKVTPEDLAKWFIWEAKYQPQPTAEMMAPQLSAIKLDKMGPVKEGMDGLAQALTAAVKGDKKMAEALREDIKATQNFVKDKSKEPYTDFRDLGHFCKVLGEDTRFAGSGVPAAAANLQKSIQDSIVAETHIGKAVKDATGLSAYLPTDYGFDMPATFRTPPDFSPTHGYDKTSVAEQTQWDELLSAIAKDSRFHEALRSVGLPDHVINKIDKTGLLAKKLGNFGLMLAGNAGYQSAYDAARGKPPGTYFKIPAEIATKAGIPGGAYKAFNGAKSFFEAYQDKELAGRGMKMFDSAADTASGAAIMASCIGLSVAQAAGIAQPAGIIAVAVPIARTVFDIYMTMKGTVKARAEMPQISPREKLEQLRLTANQHDERNAYLPPIVRWMVDQASGSTVPPSALDKNQPPAAGSKEKE